MPLEVSGFLDGSLTVPMMDERAAFSVPVTDGGFLLVRFDQPINVWTGTGAILLAGSALSGVGQVVGQGAGAITLSAASVAGIGTRTVTGTGAVQLSPATVQGAAERQLVGAGAIALGGALVSGAGIRTITGTGAVSIAAAVVSGAAGGIQTGTGAITIGAASVSGAGVRTVTGAGSINVAGAILSGTGIRTVTGSGAIALGAGLVAGTGERQLVGSGAVTLGAATVSGSGSVAGAVTGTGAITLSAATVAGSGVRTANATGDVVLPSLQVVGAGSVTSITGTGAITIGAASVSGTGTAGDDVAPVVADFLYDDGLKIVTANVVEASGIVDLVWAKSDTGVNPTYTLGGGWSGTIYTNGIIEDIASGTINEEIPDNDTTPSGTRQLTIYFKDNSGNVSLVSRTDYTEEDNTTAASLTLRDTSASSTSGVFPLNFGASSTDFKQYVILMTTGGATGTDEPVLGSVANQYPILNASRTLAAGVDQGYILGTCYVRPTGADMDVEYIATNSFGANSAISAAAVWEVTAGVLDVLNVTDVIGDGSHGPLALDVTANGYVFGGAHDTDGFDAGNTITEIGSPVFGPTQVSGATWALLEAAQLTAGTTNFNLSTSGTTAGASLAIANLPVKDPPTGSVTPEYLGNATQATLGFTTPTPTLSVTPSASDVLLVFYSGQDDNPNAKGLETFGGQPVKPLMQISDGAFEHVFVGLVTGVTTNTPASTLRNGTQSFNYRSTITVYRISGGVDWGRVTGNIVDGSESAATNLWGENNGALVCLALGQGTASGQDINGVTMDLAQTFVESNFYVMAGSTSISTTGLQTPSMNLNGENVSRGFMVALTFPPDYAITGTGAITAGAATVAGTGTVTPAATGFVVDSVIDAYQAGSIASATFTTTGTINVPSGKSLIVAISAFYDASGANMAAMAAPVIQPAGGGSGVSMTQAAAQAANSIFSNGIYYYDNVPSANKDGSGNVEIAFDLNQSPRTFVGAKVTAYVVDGLQSPVLSGTPFVQDTTVQGSAPIDTPQTVGADDAHVFWAAATNGYSDLTTVTIAGDADNTDAASVQNYDGTNSFGFGHYRDSDVIGSGTSTPNIDTNRFTQYRWVSAAFKK